MSLILKNVNSDLFSVHEQTSTEQVLVKKETAIARPDSKPFAYLQNKKLLISS
jgi:hypothetical protein